MRVFHGVNAESVARRAGTGECREMTGDFALRTVRERIGSDRKLAVSDPREGAPSRMPAISISIADRT